MKTAFLFLASTVLIIGCASGIPPHVADDLGLSPSEVPLISVTGSDEEGSASGPPLSESDAYAGEAIAERVLFHEEQKSAGLWAESELPEKSRKGEFPAPAALIEQADGQVNILMLGSDQRPDDGGFRTDVLLLVSVNPDLGSVSLTSFPRDLYVYQPDWGMGRINSAYAHGDFDLLAETFEYNFGVRPDHWVLINFDGFRQIIDALGGIQVSVSHSLSDQRDGFGEYSVEAGEQSMDAETALWYVRSRGSSDDFDRTRRQQEVLRALFFRSMSLEMLKNAPSIYEAYQAMVETDLSFGDLLPLLSIPGQLSNGNIQSYLIGPALVSPWRTETGAAVLLPDQAAIQAKLQEAVGIPSN
jgi:LCP family protein required for cell wall assembly